MFVKRRSLSIILTLCLLCMIVNIIIIIPKSIFDDSMMMNSSSDAEMELDADIKLQNFFQYFTKLYHKQSNWKFYDYVVMNDELTMIQIKKKYKKKLINKLNSVNINTTFKLNLLQKDFDNFTNSPMIDRKNKLIYTLIPKNSCTIMKTLFYGIIKNISYGLNYYYQILDIHEYLEIDRLNIFLYDAIEFENILRNESWTKIIILRDPLSRFISAFKDKCILNVPKYNAYCEKSGINYNLSINENFNTFINWIKPEIQNYNNSNNGVWNIGFQQKRHFGLQSYFGLIDIYLPYYDYIILYNKHLMTNITKLMLENIGKKEYFYHWNKNWIVNKTKMNEMKSNDDNVVYQIETNHTTMTSENLTISNKLENEALQLLHTEYEYLPFSVPITSSH